MRESFVVHAEYIEDLPEECKNIYLQYIYNYGIFDIEPENLTGFENSIWLKIKRRIDQDRKAYEERKEKNRRRQEEWRKKKEAEDPTTEVVPSDSSSVPYICTPSQTEYSKIIFSIFNNAGLPCNKNNEISFLQQDFANALSYLHKTPEYKHLHSQDVIQACKNYVAVLEDPETYFKTKMSFFKLVQSKIFYNLLPANYDRTNFESYSKTDKQVQPVAEKKWYEQTPCPSCHEQKVIWSNSHNLYRCECCGKTFKIGEI